MKRRFSHTAEFHELYQFCQAIWSPIILAAAAKIKRAWLSSSEKRVRQVMQKSLGELSNIWTKYGMFLSGAGVPDLQDCACCGNNWIVIESLSVSTCRIRESRKEPVEAVGMQESTQGPIEWKENQGQHLLEMA